MTEPSRGVTSLDSEAQKVNYDCSAVATEGVSIDLGVDHALTSSPSLRIASGPKQEYGQASVNLREDLYSSSEARKTSEGARKVSLAIITEGSHHYDQKGTGSSPNSSDPAEEEDPVTLSKAHPRYTDGLVDRLNIYLTNHGLDVSQEHKAYLNSIILSGMLLVHLTVATTNVRSTCPDYRAIALDTGAVLVILHQTRLRQALLCSIQCEHLKTTVVLRLLVLLLLHDTEKDGKLT